MPRVHNKRHETAPEDAVYIGRGSIWGNPYTIGDIDGFTGEVMDRERVIERYRSYLVGHPELVRRARRELRGKDLVCFCKPAACHGDILLKIANEERA